MLDVPADGAWNMALDQAMLEYRAKERCPPTLRLYRWACPTVSLGRFQPVEAIDLGACRELGVDVVRRPTGGRAVLHDDEITYSVVASAEDGLPRGVAASYGYLSAALAEAYRALGIPAEITRRQRGNAHPAACYLHATRADLSLGAAKLSGSAQVWRQGVCLQHGSFVISRDVSAEAGVLGLSKEDRQRLAAETKTIAGVSGRRVPDGEIVDAVVRAFETALGIGFTSGRPSEGELATARMATGRVRPGCAKSRSSPGRG